MFESNFSTAATVLVGALLIVGLYRRKQKAAKAAAESGLPPVGLWTKLFIIRCLIRFRVTWAKHRSNAGPKELLVEGVKGGWYTKEVEAAVMANPKFCSATHAVSQIPKGSVVHTSGFPAAERCAVFFWAVRELHDAKAHKDEPNWKRPPAASDLTWISTSAQGARGRAPGSSEELALDGILKRYISGHLETVKSLLTLADQNKLPIFNMPQGTIAMLIKKQGLGEETSSKTYTIDQDVGKGTFFDSVACDGERPWCLNQVAKEDSVGKTLINPESEAKKGGDYKLRYSLPAIDVAIIHARHCDLEGNIYLDENTMTTEAYFAAKAAKRHGGVVMVSVNYVLPNTCPLEPTVRKTVPSKKEQADLEAAGLFIPAALVDHIVIFNEGVSKDAFGLRANLTPSAAKTQHALVHTYNFVRTFNRILKFTPVREPTEMMVGRMAADLLVKELSNVEGGPHERLACIGVGLPEEVGQFLFTQGLCPGGVTLCTEAGTYGGLPQGGGMFGVAIHPEKLMSSSEMFELWEKKLQVACLGAIEFDPAGCVNVSRKGPRAALDFIGSGGFCNIVSSARNIIFITKWCTGKGAVTLDSKTGKVTMNHEKVTGAKLVPKVREVTYSYPALNDNRQVKQSVYIVTDVAIFMKRPHSKTGLSILAVAPGIDVRKDIVAFAKKYCPNVDFDLSADTPTPAVLKKAFVTGQGYKLQLDKPKLTGKV